MKPKISIIIATLNSGKTLKQTLDSIRHQTYKNIELNFSCQPYCLWLAGSFGIG